MSAGKLTITIKFDGEEYRVPHPKGTEASAYYTDDREDAFITFEVMWEGHKTPGDVAYIRRATWSAHTVHQDKQYA